MTDVGRIVVTLGIIIMLIELPVQLNEMTAFFQQGACAFFVLLGHGASHHNSQLTCCMLRVVWRSPDSEFDKLFTLLHATLAEVRDMRMKMGLGVSAATRYGAMS